MIYVNTAHVGMGDINDRVQRFLREHGITDTGEGHSLYLLGISESRSRGVNVFMDPAIPAVRQLLVHFRTVIPSWQFEMAVAGEPARSPSIGFSRGIRRTTEDFDNIAKIALVTYMTIIGQIQV